jgi:ABC-type lipoprotein export system ATPase subunit
MGSSGAGKTSLLNILACRITNNNSTRLTGKVLINDKLV